MIYDILKFPDERINIASADVRFFDDELHEFIDDMIDTAKANDAQGLTAIQLAVPRSIVIVKDSDGNWNEYLNPRIVKHKGKILSTESTLYLPDVIEEIPRFKSFSFVYQDRYGKDHTGKSEGHFGFLLQRKFDYIFGGTFINKLDKKERKIVEGKFAKEGVNAEFNTCPAFSKRDYFKSVMNKLLFFEALTFTAPLFSASKETLASLYKYDIFATIATFILIIGYLIYSKYEASRYISCTGCQVASFTAVAIKYFVLMLALYFVSGYLLNHT